MIAAPMQPVVSTMFEAAGFDAASGTLTVRFQQTGRAYSYAGVPPQVANDFLQAASMGRYFNEFIKGRYAFQEVRA